MVLPSIPYSGVFFACSPESIYRNKTFYSVIITLLGMLNNRNILSVDPHVHHRESYEKIGSVQKGSSSPVLSPSKERPQPLGRAERTEKST